ncbi:hypothetical protein [Streptomyces sp. NPDC058045]|uniref:hypothetical protein n=1 Tax=Streptomyces sp. NPDC058045 TaxID=3346311 RepID=UPI0036E706F3
MTTEAATDDTSGAGGAGGGTSGGGASGGGAPDAGTSAGRASEATASDTTASDSAATEVTASVSTASDATVPDADADPGAAGLPAPVVPPARRGSADPVKALLHRHRDLCERAVDPLEIAAGLEAHGITDRAAARFRHRDVFSLAEEMYARSAHDPGAAGTPAPAPAPGHTGWWCVALLPGLAGALTLAAIRLTEGRAQLAAAAVGLAATAMALRLALRHGPLRGRARRTTRSWGCLLVAYAAVGDGLLHEAVSGGPDGRWPVATAPLLALVCAVLPAACVSRFFAARAGRAVRGSRGLTEFATFARPLLLGSLALYLAALAALLWGAHTVLGEDSALLGPGCLGALLLLGRLLTVYGFTHAPAVMLGAAACAETAALATVFISWLPGCEPFGVPVVQAVDLGGPGVVQSLACGGAALVLLLHAARVLTRASAHAPGRPEPT